MNLYLYGEVLQGALREEAVRAERSNYRRMAARLAEALRAVGFFVFEKSLDPVEDVMEAVRRAGLMQVLNLVIVDRRNGIYVLELNDRGCRRSCAYEGGCGNDKTCLEECVTRCLEELRRRAVEALERVAGRTASAGNAPPLHRG